MSSPPTSDAPYRFTTASLTWAREKHATLGEWPARRADPHRVRAALLTRWFRSIFERLRS